MRQGSLEWRKAAIIREKAAINGGRTAINGGRTATNKHRAARKGGRGALNRDKAATNDEVAIDRDKAAINRPKTAIKGGRAARNGGRPAADEVEEEGLVRLADVLLRHVHLIPRARKSVSFLRVCRVRRVCRDSDLAFVGLVGLRVIAGFRVKSESGAAGLVGHVPLGS